MKLLILTQAVDHEDPILGFFHGWIKELAKHYQQVTVICLRRGSYDLPNNVRVLSFGKEEGRSRIKYLARFYWYIWRERQNYDEVFVHMNAEYVVLGACWWRFWGKKTKLWNNHVQGSWLVRLALRWADRVFYTSSFSFASRYSGHKGRRMPVGVDTELFHPNESRRVARSILFLGRVSPIKRPDVLLRALQQLDQEGVDFQAKIVGDPGESDQAYFARIRELGRELEVKDKIRFVSAAPNRQTPEIYQQSEIFVNLTNAGSFDKTIVEAAASGALLLVSNQTLHSVLPKEMCFEENNVTDLKNKIFDLLNRSETEKDLWRHWLREWAVREHGLSRLVELIIAGE